MRVVDFNLHDSLGLLTNDHYFDKIQTYGKLT
jgi:hypothetical protein